MKPQYSKFFYIRQCNRDPPTVAPIQFRLITINSARIKDATAKALSNFGTGIHGLYPHLKIYLRR